MDIFRPVEYAKISSATQRAVGEIVEKYRQDYQPIYVAVSGKPIEAWIQSDHSDYGKLW